MAHCNDGLCTRQKKETSVTPRKRNLLIAGGVSTAGFALGACLMTGLVMPDEATALATVAGTTVTSAVILIRRPSPTFVGPDGGGHASQDK